MLDPYVLNFKGIQQRGALPAQERGSQKLPRVLDPYVLLPFKRIQQRSQAEKLSRAPYPHQNSLTSPNHEQGKGGNKEPEAIQAEEPPRAPYPHENSLTSPINEEGKGGNKEPQAIQAEASPKAPYPHQNSLTSPLMKRGKEGTRSHKPSRQKSPQELLTPIRIP